MSPSELKRSLLDSFNRLYNRLCSNSPPVAGESEPATAPARRIRPPIAVSEVGGSLAILERIGCVQRDASNHLNVVKDHMALPLRVRGFAVQSYLASMIGRTLDALRAGNSKRGDPSSVTLPPTEVQFQNLSTLIHEVHLKTI